MVALKSHLAKLAKTKQKQVRAVREKFWNHTSKVHLSGDGLFLLGFRTGNGTTFSCGDLSWNVTSVFVGVMAFGSTSGPVGLKCTTGVGFFGFGAVAGATFGAVICL